MTLSNSQSSSNNSNSEVVNHRVSLNNKNCGGASRRNNCGQNSKYNSSQYQHKTESERHSKSLSCTNSTLPITSACSHSNNDMTSIEKTSVMHNYAKSRSTYSDERHYKTTSESADSSILSRGSTSPIRRYTRSALYLLRNDSRSRCRPKCASKLQSLCIWKANNSNYSNYNQQNGGNTNNSSSNNTDVTSSSLSSPRLSSLIRQVSNHDLQCGGTGSSSNHTNQKNYVDHRSISSSHLMPAFAKRRIGNPVQTSSGACTGGTSLPTSNEPFKVQSAGGKSNDHKQYISPQRKNLNLIPLSKSVQHNSSNSLDGDREHAKDRGRERDSNINSSNLSLSNARERRIGSGRLLPRDVSWDYRSDKDSNSCSASSGQTSFEKDLSSHSSSAQRISSNSCGNQNSSNQKFDFRYRSSTSKDRNSGGKAPLEFNSESRYESRKSFARGDYERDNRGDNSSYIRRFMSDLINQNAHTSYNKSGSGSNTVGNNNVQNQNENRRRNHRNDEPEWFSSGPTSQHDTIELRGFDEVEDSYSNSSENGGCEAKSNKNCGPNRFTKKNNKEVDPIYDLPSNNVVEKKECSSKSKEQYKSGLNDYHEQQQHTLNARNATPSPTACKIITSDTNNNKSSNCPYNEKQSKNPDEESLSFKPNTNNADENQTVEESNEKMHETNTTKTANIRGEEKASGFNFDVFLNVDPLNNLLMGEKNLGENEVGSRFSRWFVKQEENIKTGNDIRHPSLSEKKISLEDESQMMKNEGKKTNAFLLTNANQTNTLMEFLQRGKKNGACNTESISNVGPIPSVEELEARMRMINEEKNTVNQEQKHNNNINSSMNQFLANNVHQQQQNHAPHLIANNDSHSPPTQNTPVTGPEIQQHAQKSHAPHHHTNQLPSSQTQDSEAFKKLLEQITPTFNAAKPLTQGNIQQLVPTQQSQIHHLPPHVNILTSIGTMTPPLPPHLMKNDELTKFIQQQQINQHRQQAAISASHHPQITTSNEMPNVQNMFLAPQQRFEAQFLLQGLTRGEITQSTLGHQLSNPNTSPRSKEVIAAVLRESSGDTSPNVIVPTQQIMSPVLGQSHCAPSISTQPPPMIIASPQQIPFNNPSQACKQPGHPPSGPNTGLPQRIPSPRELQYHTQSIMQNALIKKKLEEQQENFRRRQELHKQQQTQHKTVHSPSHVEIGEFGFVVAQTQQQYPQNQQHQKKSAQHSQQQQVIQGQQQQRHVNSPTPLAFTPTSVLRKMTAEKDSVTTFHSSAPTSSSTSVVTSATSASTTPLIANPAMGTASVGTINTNPNKPMYSLLMHYQQQQQSTSSQNQPRMILGVGSHSQQQQQQGLTILTGCQQHPENSRLNQTLRNNQVKWTGALVNQISIAKPIGRPILKGSLNQSISSHTNKGLTAVNQQQQHPQTISQPPQIAFASKIEFQQIQQQRCSNSQPPPQPQHSQKQQSQSISQQQQSQNILMTHLYQQRAAVQRAQQYQLHQIHQQQQQQQINIIQNNSNRAGDRISGSNQPVSNCNNIINFQRDGGLSPTSNQLARWFSPELLAQASAGKLPPLNMNQALSLEEFEKSIQHSSTAVNN